MTYSIDLDGKIQLPLENITPILINYLENQEFCVITHRDDTKGGFTKSTDLKLNQPGIYVIYRNEVSVYCGSTDNSIGYRINRFVKEVCGKSSKKETHPGAKKFVGKHGRDVGGLSVKIIPLKVLPEKMDIKTIEELIIRELNPCCNVVGSPNVPQSVENYVKLNDTKNSVIFGDRHATLAAFCV